MSLVNNRPSANNFSYSQSLQEWTRATNVRLRLLRTKTLLGHLMAVAQQDPTVTRRVSYTYLKYKYICLHMHPLYRQLLRFKRPLAKLPFPVMQLPLSYLKLTLGDIKLFLNLMILVFS